MAAVAAGSFVPVRRQKTVTAAAGGVWASVVVPFRRFFVVFPEHCAVEEEVAELVVVDTAAQVSVERSENPVFYFYFFRRILTFSSAVLSSK